MTECTLTLCGLRSYPIIYCANGNTTFVRLHPMLRFPLWVLEPRCSGSQMCTFPIFSSGFSLPWYGNVSRVPKLQVREARKVRFPLCLRYSHIYGTGNCIFVRYLTLTCGAQLRPEIGIVRPVSCAFRSTNKSTSGKLLVYVW